MGFVSNDQSQLAQLFVTYSVTPYLEAYRLDIGSYPTTAQGLQALVTVPAGVIGWKGPYLLNENKMPTDPWGQPYQYAYPGPHNGRSKPDLWSLGMPPGGNPAKFIGNW